MKEGWKKFRKGLCKAKWLIGFMGLIFCIALLLNYCPSLYDVIHSNENADATQELNALFNFLSGAAAAILAAIAWFKFGGFYDQNQTSIMLKVDDRWGSRESVKARVMIHELYLQVRKENKEFLEGKGLECQDNLIQCLLGKKIHEMSMEIGSEKKFISLLNFLDFMETIGYIENKDHVTYLELDALCGESLIFNYKIFQEYIEKKRIRHDNPGFYVNFEKLFDKLEAEKKRKQHKAKSY